jgi:hypothetical protein
MLSVGPDIACEFVCCTDELDPLHFPHPHRAIDVHLIVCARLAPATATGHSEISLFSVAMCIYLSNFVDFGRRLCFE